MDVNQELMSKNGLACIKIAKSLIKIPMGGRLPTVTDLSAENNIPVGTAHNALKTLIKNDAIKVVSKGHMGSYLVDKDIKKLLRLIGVRYLFGAMPLPYTKRYEGLASGLISQMENSYDIPVNLAYMRGSKNRIAMLTSGRYDFAIVSKVAAEEYVKKYNDVTIVIDFGPNSYTSQHVIMFHDKNIKEIKDGMKIGVDRSSIDQVKMTERACNGKDVEFVEVQYSRIIENVIDGSIDATVMNIDEAIDKKMDINYVPVDVGLENTTAVLVVDSNRSEIIDLINEILDKDQVLTIQKHVLDGKIQPSY